MRPTLGAVELPVYLDSLSTGSTWQPPTTHRLHSLSIGTTISTSACLETSWRRRRSRECNEHRRDLPRSGRTAEYPPGVLVGDSSFSADLARPAARHACRGCPVPSGERRFRLDQHAQSGLPRCPGFAPSPPTRRGSRSQNSIRGQFSAASIDGVTLARNGWRRLESCAGCASCSTTPASPMPKSFPATRSDADLPDGHEPAVGTSGT